MAPDIFQKLYSTIYTIYRSFTALQKAFLFGCWLLISCTIFGVRLPFLIYIVLLVVTYLLGTQALSSNYYAILFRSFMRNRQDELYDLLDDHPEELRQYTQYAGQEWCTSDYEISDSESNESYSESAKYTTSQNGSIQSCTVVDDDMPAYKIEISKLVQHVFRDFVLSWYLTISDELTFAQNVHVVLEELIVAVEKKLRTVDRFEFSKKIIHMYTRHLADYQENIISLRTQPKYCKNNITFTKLNSVIEVYEKQQQFHHALADDESELNHIRSIVCSALRKLVAPDKLSSVLGIELVVEILSKSLLQPLITILSEPDFIYELLIKILADDDEAIFNEILNHHENIANGVVNLPRDSMDDEQKCSNLTIQRFQEVVESLTAHSRQFLNTFSAHESVDDSISEAEQRLRSLTTPYEDIDVQPCQVQASESVIPSVEIVQTDDDLDPVDYELLKVRTESSVSDYLMIVPNDEPDDVVPTNLNPREVRLRRALTQERRHRTITRQLSLPTLDEVHIDSIKLDHDLSQPCAAATCRKSESDKDEAVVIKCRDMKTATSSDDFDNISVSSGDDMNDEKNLTITPSTGCTDTPSRPIDLALLQESLATMPDVTSSTSLFENLYVTGTETMKEYGSPENHYICYVIQYDGWYYSGTSLTCMPRKVRRRFREFVTLQERLNENPVCRGLIKGIRAPNRWWTLPFNKTDNKIIERRKVFLEQYLQALIKKQPLAVSEELKEFLAYDSDASLAFVKKASDMPGQWLDKVILKPVSDVLDKITTVLPSLPIVTSTPDLASSLRSDGGATRRRPDAEESLPLPDRDEDALTLEYMIVADSEKFSISRLPSVLMAYLQKNDITVTDDVTSTDDVAMAEDEDIFYDADDGTSSSAKRNSGVSSINGQPVTSLFAADMPLACAVLDLGAQITSELNLTFYNEQILSVFLVFVGWYFDRFLRSEIVDISSEAMIAKYLFLLRTTIWPETEPVKTAKSKEQLDKTREWAAKCLRDFFPWFIPLVAGADNIAKSAELVMASLEHPKLNRHLVLNALDVVVETLFPDISVHDDVVRGPRSKFRSRDQ